MPARLRRPGLHTQDYKRRNVIERGFNLIKQWRGLATRYDEIAVVYRGGAVLRAIKIRTAHLVRHALVAARPRVVARHGVRGRFRVLAVAHPGVQGVGPRAPPGTRRRR